MVKMEYETPLTLQKEPERIKILSEMKLNEGFLSICSQYETIALQFLKTTKGIDAGEAEATAQHISVNSSYRAPLKTLSC